MQKATVVRNEISPLLDHLIRQLDAEGRATQKAHFKRIKRWLEGANNDIDLASPIMALSTSAHLGFQFSKDARIVIRRILEKTDAFADTLNDQDDTAH